MTLMDKIICFFMLITISAVFILAYSWVLWLLWCWVLPNVYPSGPAGLLAPGFWLFAACGALFKVAVSSPGYRRK